MMLDPAQPGFTIFDISSGNFLWNDMDGRNFYMDNPVPLLTTTFCGFLEAEFTEERPEDQCSEYEFPTTEMEYTGYFSLVLYDTLTGAKLYEEPCCSFSRTTEDYLDDLKPRVIAHGNYLLACGIQGGGDNYHQDDGMENNILCIKVDPGSKTCNVRETKTGYQMALLARAMLDEKEMMESQDKTNEKQDPKVDIQDIRFLGFAFESVAVCEVKFDYFGVSAIFKWAKTILTVDLDKIMNMEEPGSVFSAVHFPLGQSVLKHSKKVKSMYCEEARFHKPAPEYYPYYETAAGPDKSGDVRLTGIIEVSGKRLTPMTPKIYSFRKCLASMDVSAEIIAPTPAKCAKMT